MSKGQTPPEAYSEVSVAQAGRFSPGCFHGAGAELHVSPPAPFLAHFAALLLSTSSLAPAHHKSLTTLKT